jgi:rRNA maturation RNase YbeY
MVQPIHFHYLADRFHFSERTRLKKFIAGLARAEGFSVEAINYIFCTDAYLLTLNKKYLNHSTYTDIISFQFSQPSAPLLSDIYISVERVRDNARQFNSSFSQELHRVIFHGVLHLCGYQDKKPSQARQMREKENYYLRKYRSTWNTGGRI